MSKQSISEIIDSWETHGLQNLHEISLDRIYAFPLTRNDIDIRESSIQWHLDHHGISRQRLVETTDEQVKSLMVDIENQLRELSERTWKHILETKIYWCESTLRICARLSATNLSKRIFCAQPRVPKTST